MSGLHLLRASRPGLRLGAIAALAAVAALILAACGSSSSSNPLSSGTAKSVVVGSANFPESEVLAEIYVLALQSHGIKVTPKLNIGAREVYYPQIVKGALTILPEYNGALLLTSVDPTSTAATTAQVDADLTAKLPSSLEILNPAAAQDKDSVTVTQTFATAHHLTSIDQLKPVAGSMVIGAGPEFATRHQGLLGLESVYGLHFKKFLALGDESGPITLKALTSGQVQAADIFTTTPYIVSSHLVVLADPQSLFAAQNVIPLVYKKGVDPQIVSILNAISAKLTTLGLLQMDTQLYVNHQSYQTVAANWLKSVGMG